MSALPAPHPFAPGEALRFQAANAQGIKEMIGNNPGRAIAYYEEALGIYRDAGVVSNYGDALAKCGRLEEAMAAFRESVELDPNYAQGWYNLGVSLNTAADYEGAREAYRRSLELKVDHKAMNNLGNVNFWTLRLAEAEHCYRRAWIHGFKDSAFNLALCLMMQGKFYEGWMWYHQRPQMVGLDESNANLWRGESLKGKTLLVLTEQGLGDSIFALRFIPLLREQGASLIMVVDAGLKRLVEAQVAECGLPSVRVVEKGIHQNVMFDYQTLAMSIPLFVTPEGTGPNTAYLKARKVPLPADTLNVGLCWNGSTAIGMPAERNIPLRDLAPLAAIPGVRLYSLQKGDGVDEIDGCGFAIEDPMASVRDIYDTACVIESLDLVITIDTLPAHLAGALGKPTWLLNRYASCWQWGLEPGFDPKLYASVYQFRQEKRGDWAPVIKRVADCLMVVTARSAPPELREQYLPMLARFVETL